MLAFWFCVGLAQCGLLYLLARCGRALIRKAEEERAGGRFAPPGGWPRAAMIVPVAGTHPRMADALQSLLNQDYPDLMPVLVTATAEEPAAELVRRLREDFPAVRHVVAGPADGCGQKNHNSLQGVAAVGDAADVYIFCDSTHLARPDFARCLGGPVARGEAAFSTGYHTVEPRDRRPVTLAYALSVLLMRFLQALSAFTQPWGGAMAMSRDAFERYGVAELWAHNVVDDCSLGALLQGRGVHVRLCAAALLSTEAADHSLPVWRAWMERQVLFLKFCMPGQWLLLGVLAALMALPPVCAGLALLGGLLGLGSGAASLLGLLWLAALAGTLGPWRDFLPRTVPLGRWIWAFVCAAGMFVLVYLRSIPAKAIVWRDRVYTVGQGGTVLNVRRR